MIFKKLNFRANSYDRPTASYRCGEQCAQACTLGPKADGSCRGSTECVPRMEDDRWVCTRSGEPCEQGPDHLGRCCREIYCVPQANYRGLRKNGLLLVFSMFFAVVILLLLILEDREFVSPGPLSPAHSMLEDDSCETCHKVDEKSQTWLQQVFHSSTALACDSCHFENKTDVLSTHALHPQGEMAIENCASCHQEHHGERLSESVESRQCVSCHTSEWMIEHKPHERLNLAVNEKGFIRGFHRRGKHNDYAEQLGCRGCHNEDKSQSLKADIAEQTCFLSCHKKEFAVEARNTTILLSLPAIDVTSLSRQGLNIGAWPKHSGAKSLTGLEMAWLSSRGFSDVVGKIQSGELKLSDLSTLDASELARVEAFIWEYKALVQQARGGFYHLFSDVKAYQTPLFQETLVAVIDKLFPGLKQELLARSSGHVIPHIDVAIDEKENTRQLIIFVKGKGLLLQAQQHGDSQIIHLIQALQSGGDAERIAAATSDMFVLGKGFKAKGKLCAKCHSSNEFSLPTFQSSHHSKFDHQTHASIVSTECKSCHLSEPAQKDDKSGQGDKPSPQFVEDFHSMYGRIDTEQCFSCHTPEKSDVLGECLTCHSFHLSE